jgi:hypothetical protein
MSTQGAGRGPRRARQASFAVLVGLAAMSLGGCGEEDFTNEPPRAAAEINVAVKVDQRQVVVQPNRFGAGLVNFTITNFSDEPVRFTLSGPKDAASEEIPAGATSSSLSSAVPTAGNYKVELPEGSYQASAGDAASPKPDTVQVGPQRQGSQSKLLLP